MTSGNALASLVDATSARRSGAGWMALCPAHEDQNPSLAISEAGGRALVHCHAGCETGEVLAALNMGMTDLYDEPREPRDPEHWLPRDLGWVDSYDYTDSEGALVFQVIRARKPNQSKTFIQRQPDRSARSGWAWNLDGLSAERKDIPYRLPALRTAIERGESVWIAEGEKDTEALVASGVAATCNRGGASENRRRAKWTPLHAAHLRGATVTVVQDKDAPGRAHAAAVVASLSGIAESVRLVEAREGKDAHDHLAAGFGLEDFVEVAFTNESDQQDANVVPAGTDVAQIPVGVDPFADSPISERVVAEAMLGRWCWTAAGGWMAWTGSIWKAQPDVAAAEVARQWVDAEVARVASQGSRERTRAASALQSESRIARILKLCRGQVLATLQDFDQNPDFLVCSNGVVDLTTGDLLAHDPVRLVTKSTGVEYERAAKHADWAKALTAVPQQVRDWLQIRLGQAATGYTPTDHRMPLLRGSGYNAKSTLIDGWKIALGTYAGAVPESLLVGDHSIHPTQYMTLRGLRLAYVEETPEQARLNIPRLKKLLGTREITARGMRQDFVTFQATHALIISSNYQPTVSSVDHGTWRRLCMVTFPYTYGDKPGNRPRDETLGDRVRTDRVVQRAVLAWVVEGAQAWYANGKVLPPLPEAVEKDTLAWRAESDLVMAYATDRLVMEPGAVIAAQELTRDLNCWLRGRNHQEWADRTVSERFSGHECFTTAGVEKKKARHPHGSLSRSTFASAAVPAGAFAGWVGVRFRTAEDDLAEEPVPGVPGTPVSSSRVRISNEPTYLEHLEHLEHPLPIAAEESAS